MSAALGRSAAWALRGDEPRRLRRLYEAAVRSGRGSSAVRPESRVAWQRLYDYVGVLAGRGRSGREIATAPGVKPQRVSQMLDKATAYVGRPRGGSDA